MDYLAYYQFCLKGNAPPVDVSKFTHQVLPIKFDISDIKEVLFANINNIVPIDWIKKVPYNKQDLSILTPVLDKLIGYLEINIYGCSIFIDKLFIYRSIYHEKRTSSALYHYDNTPPTQLKTIIYLNDVLDDSDGPIEFCDDFLQEPTRRGPNYWCAPPNNSRFTENEMSSFKKVKIYGETGTSTLFYPSNVHRANPPIKGKVRDVINILTQPTHNPNDRYKYMSGFESSGSPLMNPMDRRQ